ncbi:MAG: hypothetical protein J7J46_02995 [Candidatus Desulfofervidus sp.]|nr:hypothetical protein [Candidatus Desulfofervidus sp.]
MSRFLVQLLARAVPEVRVKSARIVCWNWHSRNLSEYYILVKPHHKDYWGRFHIRYPHCKQLARKRGVGGYALGYRGLCPEFYTKRDLIEWLADTLNLSQGERNLLRLCRRM